MCKSTRYLYLENPEIFKQIHPTENEGVDLMKLAFSTHKKIWWLCLSGHSYYSTVNSKTNQKSGCPYCANQKVCIDNCLATLNPIVSSEWHLIKNGTLTPFDVTAGSNKKVWWKCEKEHEWISSIRNRDINNSQCLACNNNGTSFIEKKFYYYLKLVFENAINCHKIDNANKRKIEVDIFIPELNLAIEYDGWRFHIEAENINRDILKNIFLKEKKISLIRIRESKLPIIHNVEFYNRKTKDSFKNILINILDYILNNFSLNKNQIKKIDEVKNIDFGKNIIPNGFFIYPLSENSLLIKNPELSNQWHPELNGDLKPKHISCGSTKRVWWICERKHSWISTVVDRNNKSGCPYCANKKACSDNCLATTNPELAKEWNYIKNIFITPFDVVGGSTKRVWWICENKHEWETTVNSRNGKVKRECPYCNNRKVCLDNCLATTNPPLSTEWHPLKNELLTPFDVVAGSKKKVWWICEKKHEWSAEIRSRNNGSNCPTCNKLLKQSKKISFNLL